MKLKYCNWALLFVLLVVTVSSIQMEISGGNDFLGIPFVAIVLIHVFFSSMMLVLVFYHLYLHFGNKRWKEKISKLRSPVSRMLVWIALLTAISSLIALFHWIVAPEHSLVGAIHGKIGFLFLIISIGHIVKRIKWFRY